MCGIAGIVGPGWTRRDLESMQAALRHRGPDDGGLHEDREAGLAHTRLSILDLSAAGRQPMASPDGALWLVFNGEVYNYVELRTELSGYPFRTGTDSEVVLAAYERWGAQCVEHFVGMFAFALWDARRRALFCARDRLGIKPFHYAWHEGRFLFASEVKALLAAGLPAVPDEGAWAAYLAHGYMDHGPGTFFEGVRVLPAGHTLFLEGGRAEVASYWDLPALAAEPLRLTEDEAAARLRALFDDAVRIRLRSDVPLGVNLSGGLDSSALMATVDRLQEPGAEVQAFTAGFDDPRYDETGFADRVPRRAAWHRRTTRLTADAAWGLLDEAAWHQEAPFGGVSTLGYHLLHKVAREHGVKVLLEGQGADELLGGYAYVRREHHRDLLREGRLAELRAELAAEGVGPAGMDAAIRGLGAPRANVHQDGTQHLRPECIAPEVRARAGPEPAFKEPFQGALSNALHRDLAHTKLPRVLRMNDRLSMASGVELRETYLDHRIVELAFRLPGDLKVLGGVGKHVLRKAMADRLPDAVRLAPKRGVVTPQREWLRGPLRERVRDIIGSQRFRERGLFDAAEVERAFETFCRGEGDNSFFVWQWIAADAWHRAFVEAPRGAPHDT